MWSLQLGAGSVTPRRPFRVWLLSVIFPNGKQVVVMWNRKDCVSHVKKYLELKTSLPRELQILHKKGVSTPLVDEHLLFNSNVRDEDVVVLSMSPTSSFQVFLKGRNGKNTFLWAKSLDKVTTSRTRSRPST